LESVIGRITWLGDIPKEGVRDQRRQVLGPLLNRMIVNPDPQREEAEHKARSFFLFLFLIDIGDFCALKGASMPPWSPA
jgi:hypothetical protein